MRPRYVKVWSCVSFVSVLLCATCGNGLAKANPKPAQERKQILQRLQEITILLLPDWRFHTGDVLGGETPNLDDSAWKTLKVGEEWDTGPAWFRRWIEIPASLNGYGLRGATLRFRVRISGENPVHLTIYFNGAQSAEGNDLGPVVLTSSAEPGQKVLIAVEAQVPGGRTALWTAQLELDAAPGRPDPRMLLEECLSAEALIEVIPEGRAEHAGILDAALHSIDWAALGRSDQKAFDQSLDQTRAKLQPLAEWLRGFAVRATGNSHIDMAWLWPWTETVEVVRNTFSSVLKLMREFPDFTFTMSSAQAYAWMEEKYPHLFEQIRQRVREGRWEPIGGMWVEPDLNMPDGESIVRQLLVGKRYFKQKFGVDIRVGWNPDSFGYNWQLPQIYKKSGVDFFVTQKLFWNDTTKFPYKLFWWEAPDGSRVLTYFPQDYGNPVEPVRVARDLAEYVPAMCYPEMMHLYGVGDHGGGPTREMLETTRRWRSPSALYPRLFFGTAQEYFDELTSKVNTLKIPIWRDELYLEYHRGVYTSQAETKKRNRRSEVLLLDAERFAALAFLFGQPYPRAEFEEAWRKVLFNQFHDILSGSGVAAVYRDAARDYAEVRRMGNQILAHSLDELTAHANTLGPGVPVVVFNPLAWSRTDTVEVEAQFPRPVSQIEVQDPARQPVLAEIVARDAATHRLKVRFLAEAVPSTGYKVFHLVPVVRPRRPASSLVARPDLLENEFLRLRVDPKTGCITSLFEKVHQLEILAPSACGNLLQAFYDKPREYDAWNIDANFEDQKWDLLEAEEVKLVESGPVRGVLRVKRKFRNSTFLQDITLYPKIPRVDVRTEADWHERHTLLKVAFPVAARSDFATFEIPFGAIPRPTTRRTPAERAKFEVPALRWADLSDSKLGLSLLNDSKYGYDAKGNVLRLSLLRSPTYPDAEADQGQHQFTYALLPHAGTWKGATTVRRGYELNYPLLPVVTTAHEGSLPPAHSFVQLEPENVVLTAVKKAEDDNGLIFRFYESAGQQTQVRLRLPPGASQAIETNLMENEQGELSLQGTELVVPVRPYEIKCLKVKFQPGSRGGGGN